MLAATDHKMNCVACKQQCAKEFLRCRLCIGKFHYQCLNIDTKQFIAITKGQASAWVCPACSNVTRRTRTNENSPVRPGHLALRVEDSMDISCDLSDQNNTLPQDLPSTSQSSHEANTSSKEEVTMDRISAVLDEKLSASLSTFMDSFRKAIREDVKEMVKSEIGSALKSITDDFGSSIEFISEDQKELRSNINREADRVKQLEVDNAKLKAEINKLNSRLMGIDKISRNCNIELQAVPERKNENVLTLFKRLCEVVKVSLEDSHITACRRVAKLNNASKRPRNIVVSFSTPRIRDSVLSATQKFNKTHPGRGLRSTDLDMPGEPCRIFVSEHLSPEQKTLHAETRRVAKELKYKYVWVRYGQIYVRKDDSAGAFLVRDLDSLNKLH